MVHNIHDPKQKAHTLAFRVCGQAASWKTSSNLKNAFLFHSVVYFCKRNIKKNFKAFINIYNKSPTYQT